MYIFKNLEVFVYIHRLNDIQWMRYIHLTKIVKLFSLLLAPPTHIHTYGHDHFYVVVFLRQTNCVIPLPPAVKTFPPRKTLLPKRNTPPYTSSGQ